MSGNTDARGYWMLAGQFLRLAEAASTEIANHDNPHVIVSSGPISPTAYGEATRWSDHAIGAPVLFNFLHGIELTLKGLLNAAGGTHSGHQLSRLFYAFQSSFTGTGLEAALSKVLLAPPKHTPFSDFLSANNINIDVWYEALRYPESKQGRMYDHLPLKYGEFATAPFWRDVARQSAEIRRGSVTLARERGYAL